MHKSMSTSMFVTSFFCNDKELRLIRGLPDTCGILCGFNSCHWSKSRNLIGYNVCCLWISNNYWIPDLFMCFSRNMQIHARTCIRTQTHSFTPVCSYVKRNLTYLMDRNYSYATLLTPQCSAWETML